MDSEEFTQRVHEALGGVLAKVNRADAHLEVLDHVWTEYIRADPCPYTFSVYEDPDTGDNDVHVEIVEQPPDVLSVIVGDVLHNLRSGLDHLAWELVKRAGGKPGRHTCFPICDTEDEWIKMVEHRRRSDDRRSPLDGIEPESPIWQFIQAVQPYKGAIYAEAMTDLRVLSNADKHRTLLVSGVYPDPDDFAAILHWNPEAVLRRQEIFLTDKPLEDGDEVASLNFDPRKPDPNLYVEGELGFDIAFSDGKWDSGRAPIAELQAALGQYVEFAAALFVDPPHFEDPALLADLMERSAAESD